MSCRHLHAVTHGAYQVGKAWCPECKQLVHVSDVINNLLAELRNAIGQVRKEVGHRDEHQG